MGVWIVKVQSGKSKVGSGIWEVGTRLKFEVVIYVYHLQPACVDGWDARYAGRQDKGGE
jgi:hypothetical protein